MFTRKKTLYTTKLVDDNIPLEKRIKRAEYFKNEYPDSVPIYIQYSANNGSGNIGRLHRYVVPKDNSYGHLLLAFRRTVKLKSSMGMISLVERIMPDGEIKAFLVTTATTIEKLAEENLHYDGFLYINITSENTFG